MDDECAGHECDCHKEGRINTGYVVINSPDLTFVQSEAELPELYAPGTAVWFTEDEGETFHKVIVPEKKILREWISVEERKPRPGTPVFVWDIRMGHVWDVGAWDERWHNWMMLSRGPKWHWSDSHISHWMPLPDPPPGQGDD